MMRMRIRKAMAMLLMALGAAMLGRGLVFTVKAGLGWQGMAQALVVGTLVFALGFIRWRYWRQR